MRCRTLSPSHNIVWFGKTGEDLDWIWFSFNSIDPDNPAKNIRVIGKTKISGAGYSQSIEWGALENVIFYDTGTFDDLIQNAVTWQFNYNGYTYTCVPDTGSRINGKIFYDETQVGIYSFTNIGANEPVINYTEGSDAVADSLIQRLSVLKGELWYQINFGLPLTEKYQSSTVFDMVIADIITAHPGVAALETFNSSVENHTYSFECSIRTAFGDALQISNSYMI